MAPLTRKRVTRWERSVVWGMLRNPAYKGTACFNKTKVGPRQKVTKPFRLSGRAVHGEKTCAPHERRREEWIDIPVPALVSEETFALAAERLADNKCFAPRRTIEPSLVQGLVSCRKCGYALYRTLTRSSARKNPLLPLPGFGWLAPSRRFRLRQPRDPPGSSRPHHVAGGHLADRGSWAHHS
ncbi:recombinase family protein [Mesorhizobium australicum]|uniref:Recombinase family protein n=1 Tax=Mesorhizobium australicum TaxID=536018 RepID=A0ACC6T923_9HYPH